MSTFDKLDQEAVDDWRMNTTTEAFVDSVRATRSMLVDEILNSLKGGAVQSSRLERLGGQLDVVDGFLAALVKS